MSTKRPTEELIKVADIHEVSFCTSKIYNNLLEYHIDSAAMIFHADDRVVNIVQAVTCRSIFTELCYILYKCFVGFFQFFSQKNFSLIKSCMICGVFRMCGIPCAGEKSLWREGVLHSKNTAH